MQDLTDLTDGDVIKHSDSGALREVHSFIKDFSGDRHKAKLRPRRDITHKFDDCPGNVPGHERLEAEDVSDWERVDL